MCTAVIAPAADGLLLGHNYDFVYGHGLIARNRRGLRKRALLEDGQLPVEWTSRFASLTANQFALELPVCGVNEAGLGVAMLWHEDGRLPSPDGRPAVNELQWIQVQLDTCGSVGEVIDLIEQIRIAAALYTLHYVLCDASGDSAIVEFIAGGPDVIRRPRPAVLSNSSYARSVRHTRNQDDVPTASLSRSPNALDRFALAARLAADLAAAPATAKEVFELLGALAIRPSSGDLARWLLRRTPPSTTQWTTVIDPVAGKLAWRTPDAAAQWACSLRPMDLDRRHVAQVMDLREPGRGDAMDRLRPFRVQDNRRIVQASFAPLRDRFPEAAQEALAAYPNTFHISDPDDGSRDSAGVESSP